MPQPLQKIWICLEALNFSAGIKKRLAMQGVFVGASLV
jgi:hypothetical protein